MTVKASFIERNIIFRQITNCGVNISRKLVITAPVSSERQQQHRDRVGISSNIRVDIILLNIYLFLFQLFRKLLCYLFYLLAGLCLTYKQLSNRFHSFFCLLLYCVTDKPQTPQSMWRLVCYDSKDSLYFHVRIVLVSYQHFCSFQKYLRVFYFLVCGCVKYA